MKGLTDDLWAWWRDTATSTRTLQKEETLFHRDDVIVAMYRVEEGAVRLERRTIDGRLLVLHTAGPGELVAEASLFAQTYHCDASAVHRSRVSLCRRADLLRALSDNAAMALQWGRMVARQLQEVRHRLEFRNVRSAGDRVLLYLELYADPETRTLAVQNDLQDIAAELGLTREAFYRTLASLERKGSIARHHGGITLAS